MKVLLTVTSLLPSYGGPAVSVPGLAAALADAGAEVGIWAPDQSAAAAPNLPSESQVQRLVGTEIEALARFGKPDVLHDNGIWLPHHHRLALLAVANGIPRVVSTRGMLEPWALRHRRLKKRVAWALFQQRDLKRASLHHATAEAEAENVRGLRLGVPVVVSPNGVNLPEQRSRAADSPVEQFVPNSPRTALFLSRIHPKKGLPMLVEAWARVRPKGWILQIAGPDEGGHQKAVETAVRAAGLGDVVVFSGPVHDRAKWKAYSQADLFVLPTHSENFGIVIAEALAHGVPVLTTTGAPWPALAEFGCGWRVEATVDGIVKGLATATRIDSDSLRAMGRRGRSFVSAEFSWKRIANVMLSQYQGILASPAEGCAVSLRSAAASHIYK
jgi:glycosyltransferase involved in cell wall biosynthesis